MTIKKHDRQYDLVVWGATGYTGKRVAHHIAAHFPTNLKWALAGRTESKLRAVAERCAALNPDRCQPDIETCNLNHDELSSLARKSRVLIACVGPFARLGELAYEACATEGTHYLDITGEFPFTVAMVKKYEERAKASGALMFSQAAVESTPSDVCTWALVNKVKEEGGTAGDVTIVLDIVSAPSGGTLASAIGLFKSYTPSQIVSSAKPYALSPVPNPARRATRPSLLTRLTGLRTLPHLGPVTTSLTNRADGLIVERTWGLHQSVPSLREQQHAYGPRFTWAQYMSAPSSLAGAAIHLGIAAAGVLLFIPPVRWLVRRFIYAPGTGPNAEDAEGDVVRYRGLAAEADGGTGAYCEAQFRGSMYIFSAILVAQAALTLLEDDVDLPGGCYTPACLGEGLIDRLALHGFAIETKALEE